MKKHVDRIKKNIEFFDKEDQAGVIEKISSLIGGSSESHRERILNSLSLMMNGSESVDCKNCGAVAFLDGEELEAFKIGRLACGKCNEILKENGE